MSRCSIAELRDKEVVNVCDGARLGYVSDVEVDVCDGRVMAIIVPGESGCFSFSQKKEDDLIIPWPCIEMIGEEIILVKITLSECRRQPVCCDKKKKGLFS